MDHIADFLIFLSRAPYFWFSLNTSRLLSRHPLVILSCQLVVAEPLVILSLCRHLVNLSHQLVVASPLLILSLLCPLVILSRQLVVTFPLAVLLLRHPLVNSLHQLVVASPLLVLSLRPVPPSHPLVGPSGCCIASQCAALSSSRHLVVSPLVVSLRQLVVASSSFVILSLHRPLILSS